ncbi:MAG: 3-oxoacyl-[acyl-carrier-protein] synthase III C-terminal domain-containing protein, partial [Myxococcota bacterium]
PQGPSTVLSTFTLHDPPSAADMGLQTMCGRLYWQAGPGALNIKFADDKFQEIIQRGNRLVPEAVRGVCDSIDAKPDEIDLLVTNQPNRLFLRNWRTDLGIDEDRHFDTFDRFGNLYGAGLPITLAQALEDGRVQNGHLIVVAGFAHAGDFAAASAIRWRSSNSVDHA